MRLENLEINILLLKLIQAFQANSKTDVDSLIEKNASLIKLNKSQGPLGPNDIYILHAAVQVASPEMIRHLLHKFPDAPAFDINAPEPHTGNTPLHIAAKFGRSDVVMYLLSFDEKINDMLTNNDGKQPVEVARTPELAEAMQVVRAQFLEKVATRMKKAFTRSDIKTLETILANPRANALLDINGQNPDTGTTVLHDAVRARNVPMVEFILSHGGDPLLRNSKGVLPIDLTKDDTIRRLLKQSTKSQQVVLQSTSINPALLKNRNQKSLDKKQGGTDDSSAGAPADHPSLMGPPPTMKGFLKKWTNFTSGYKLRWFVLENGVLSYYKRQDDTANACRGSINMRNARLHLDSSEKLQFEVLSGTSVKFHLKSNHPIETNRWVWALNNAIQYAKDQDRIKSQNPRKYQSNRTNSISSLGNGTPSTAHLDTQLSSSQAQKVSSHKASNSSQSIGARPTSVLSDDASSHSHNVARLVHMNNVAMEQRERDSGIDQQHDKDVEQFEDDYDDDDDDDENDFLNREEPPYTAEIASASDSITVALDSVQKVLNSLSDSINHGTLTNDELKTGLSTLEQALNMTTTLVNQYTSHVSNRELYYTTKLERSNQLQDLWTKSIHELEVEKAKVQEELHKAIQKKRQANKVLREVAGGAAVGTGLLSHRTSIVYKPRRESFIYPESETVIHSENGTNVPVSKTTTNVEESVAAQAAAAAAATLIPVDSTKLNLNDLNNKLQTVEIESESESELEDEFFDALGSGDEGYIEEPQPPNVMSIYNKVSQRGHEVKHDLHKEHAQLKEAPLSTNILPSAVVHPAQPQHPAPVPPVPQTQQYESMLATQPQIQQQPLTQEKVVEPGFGAAAEVPATTASAYAPSLVEGKVSPPSSSVAPSVLENEDTYNLTEVQREKLEDIVKDNSFAGYEDGPRKRLKMDGDDRPKISLWGVLKNLIGKDMTRMTLPVSFNECTNLLQRSAEDMEYTYLLDKAAAAVSDAGERMAYIAAFAASSYSSTTERVAKPFNPLLGETFEYARPDRGYRMFSEQVSHHPPIGALMAESPRWDFYGASNVKSKFYGRSFDINPLGLWYITLRPNKGDDVAEEEVYSFRKVTSSVVGIITGSPVVDNYGDMEIINYTNGYKCTLKFKARGWRSDGAYEVRGTVFDKAENPQWIVGGRWNDKIFGKKLASREAELVSNGKAGDLGEKSNRVLLWKVNPRPKAPFNLTAFAITLNDIPNRLIPWLASTDTRFRPDQRAMEEGRYDDAADDKHRVEEKQRDARRKREAEGVSYSPLWFEQVRHPLSGQEYWRYKGNYWECRAQHDWEGVPDIY